MTFAITKWPIMALALESWLGAWPWTGTLNADSAMSAEKRRRIFWLRCGNTLMKESTGRVAGGRNAFFAGLIVSSCRAGTGTRCRRRASLTPAMSHAGRTTTDFMSTEKSNPTPDAAGAPSPRVALWRFVRRLGCRAGLHRLELVRPISEQAALVECPHCGRKWARYMAVGINQDGMIPWENAEPFYRTFPGYKK